MLRKNSEFGCVRVELAFRPASKPFFLFESALADDTKLANRSFSASCLPCRKLVPKTWALARPSVAIKSSSGVVPVELAVRDCVATGHGISWWHKRLSKSPSPAAERRHLCCRGRKPAVQVKSRGAAALGCDTVSLAPALRGYEIVVRRPSGRAGLQASF